MKSDCIILLACKRSQERTNVSFAPINSDEDGFWGMDTGNPWVPETRLVELNIGCICAPVSWLPVVVPTPGTDLQRAVSLPDSFRVFQAMILAACGCDGENPLYGQEGEEWGAHQGPIQGATPMALLPTDSILLSICSWAPLLVSKFLCPSWGDGT